MVICVPSGITGVEQRAVQEAAEYAGARKPAYIIEEPMAAAIGAGLPVQEPTGNMIVDIGGGTTEVAVISLGGIVASQSVRVGGDELDDAIIQFIKKEYSLALGERTAEEVKIALGSAWPLEEELHAEIRGRDLVTGLPKTIVTTTEEIREAIEEPVAAIVDAVKVTLDKTPPELAADIMEQGIVLAGGGALLHGLAHRLEHETGMPIVIAAEPAALRGDRLGPVARGVRGAEGRALLLELAGLAPPAPRGSVPAHRSLALHAAPARARVDHAAHPRLPRTPDRSQGLRDGAATVFAPVRDVADGVDRPVRRRLERHLRLRRPRRTRTSELRERIDELEGERIEAEAAEPRDRRAASEELQLKQTSRHPDPVAAEVVSGPLTSFDATIADRPGQRRRRRRRACRSSPRPASSAGWCASTGGRSDGAADHRSVVPLRRAARPSCGDGHRPGAGARTGPLEVERGHRRGPPVATGRRGRHGRRARGPRHPAGDPGGAGRRGSARPTTAPSRRSCIEPVADLAGPVLRVRARSATSDCS